MEITLDTHSFIWYLDNRVKEFFSKKALARNIELDKVINTILSKEMEILKGIEA